LRGHQGVAQPRTRHGPRTFDRIGGLHPGTSHDDRRPRRVLPGGQRTETSTVDRAMSRHLFFDPEGLPPASGFSYGAISSGGRLLHIAGMTGRKADGTITDDLVEQFSVACEGVARVIDEAGGEPSDLVS